MTRLRTAVLIIVPLLAALWYLPAPLFVVLLALVALAAWVEYVRLADALAAAPPAGPGAVLTVLCVLGLGRPYGSVVLLGAILLGVTACVREHRDDPRRLLGSAAATTVGLVWIGALLGAQGAIRLRADGLSWLLLAYATVAIGDSAAYYGGSLLGRHKLAPALSPRKTLEGAGFGLAASALTGAIAATWIPSLSPPMGAGVGLVLGGSGQLGDLLESALKRAAAVKDSADLLPGHGGVLDRIDAHLLAGATLWVLLVAGLGGS